MRSWIVLSAMLGAWTACVVPPPTPEPLDAAVPGNSCESALAFALPDDGGLVSLSGDATGFGDHVQCLRIRSEATGMGPDVIHRFTATRPLAIEARIDGGTVHLGDGRCITNCDGSFLVSRLSAPFNREHLLVSLAPGEHSLFAEAAGPWAIDVRASPLAPGDRCDAPLIAVTDAGPFVLEADLVDYYDEGHPASPLRSSFHTRSADLFIALPVTVYSGVRTRATGLDAGLPRLSLLAQCGDDLPEWDGRSDFVLPPGTSALRAWTETSRDEDRTLPFRLELEVQPLELGDRCDTPLPLAFSEDGGVAVATMSGDTSSWFPTRFATCGDGFSGDLFAEFTLASPRTLSAVVSTSSPTFRPVLGLRAGTCTEREALCESAAFAGAGASLDAAALPAGRYVLTVGGANRVGGAFTLSVTLSP